ncbi:transcriptional regulator, LysR family [Burkholderia sp. lig30]|jgi:DNA-binding transcriptional LysR family regulator|uniref:LysR substrate-binding domain-containing protein n=1 Tax=Burkholderia sp. lig30 TaxID=1192124 RepID=UPI000460ECA8|nr:LysR substrate-binding domain-containing protein [Burkholderia sp. lig30]KDB08579.1 transcriptional regulator, LysR family [Burkholderia sp. lig30]
MEFRQLRYFLAVAEYLHFTEAAEFLGIAQPPLSQQILKLEREIGTRLFIRHPRRVELTEAGRLFRERAARIVEEADLALAEAQNAGRGESGRLVLGFAGSIVFHPLVASLMQRYRRDYPGVLIKCEESNSPALLDKVLEARVDAALIRLPLDCRELAVQPLVEEEFLAVLPSGHRASADSALALRALSGDPLVLFPRSIGPDLYDAIVGACHAAGFTPAIGMESPQISSAVNMVAAGFGVTLIPESVRQVQARGVTYHALQGEPLRTGIALVHRPREKSPVIRNLARAVRELARDAAA